MTCMCQDNGPNPWLCVSSSSSRALVDPGPGPSTCDITCLLYAKLYYAAGDGEDGTLTQENDNSMAFETRNAWRSHVKYVLAYLFCLMASTSPTRSKDDGGFLLFSPCVAFFWKSTDMIDSQIDLKDSREP
ncbi:hypothetical protein V2G26_000487 [Clonostachys chloroleuca]